MAVVFGSPSFVLEKEEKTSQEETKKYKRFLFHGGALKSSDNSAFLYAAKNVEKDYNNDGEVIRKSVDSAKTIVDLINSQKDNTIQSIDFFCHGTPIGVYFIKGTSIYNDITTKERNKNDLNSSLYIGKGLRLVWGWELSGEDKVLSDIDYSKFTNSCKIEIHGCLTAGTIPGFPFLDNFCEDLSEYLYKAGKENSVVIGHSTKANANINGDKTKNEEQDYRHGKRKVFNNGNVILEVVKKGRITGLEIKEALNKR